jgi:hypothetical protein
MERKIDLEAQILRLGLMTGCFSVTDVVSWADKLIVEQDTPAYELLDLSLMANSNRFDVAKLLESLAKGVDTFEALRILLSFLYLELSNDHQKGATFAYGLYGIATQNYDELPKEFYYFLGLEDQYSLAKQELAGYDPKEITGDFLNYLESYEKNAVDFSHLLGEYHD